MMKRLRHEVGCYDEIIDFVQNGFPKDLEHEYKRLFERYSNFELKYVTYVPILALFPGASNVFKRNLGASIRCSPSTHVADYVISFSDQ